MAAIVSVSPHLLSQHAGGHPFASSSRLRLKSHEGMVTSTSHSKALLRGSPGTMTESYDSGAGPSRAADASYRSNFGDDDEEKEKETGSSSPGPNQDPRKGANGRRAGDKGDDDRSGGDGNKVYKAISRVQRACNACRKQKARCEGSEHPPCCRCKASGIECIFEKPPKESANTDVGIERIKSLETQMTGMQSMLGELVATLKANTQALGQQAAAGRSTSPARPAPFPPNAIANYPHFGQEIGYGPLLSAAPYAPYLQRNLLQPPPSRSAVSQGPFLQPAVAEHRSPNGLAESDRRSYPWSATSSRATTGISTQPRSPAKRPDLTHRNSSVWNTSTSVVALNDQQETASVSSGTPGDSQSQQRWRAETPGSTSISPPAAPRSASRHTRKETDLSNDQLSAPIEALRGLADAAAAAADADQHSPDSQVDKQTSETGQKRTFGDAQGHDASGRMGAASINTADSIDEFPVFPKRHRKNINVSESGSRREAFLEKMALDKAGDLVSLGLVSIEDAQRLFRVFGQGVPKFISIFHFEDADFEGTQSETMETIRTSSYFLFNVILVIGAKVECGGKPPSRLYHICMAQAKRNAEQTLFQPVKGKEAVQAMILLAAYQDNGWLPVGISIRMAQELGLDMAFQKLMTRLPPGSYIRLPPPAPPRQAVYHHGSPQSSMYSGSPADQSELGISRLDKAFPDGYPKGNMDELRELARGARLWFFLFLFDHQTSFGAGRPAMLSKHYVRNCRAFLSLQPPLAIDTDVRFVSTLELVIIRETHYNAMAPYDQPVDGRMLIRMRKVTQELNEWYRSWGTELTERGYGNDSFFQQSLVLQCASAELYLTCTALRGIKDANDVDRMGPEQKELIVQATRAADTCLSIAVNSKEYREMLGYAPHYTHVTAAFACVFLIKIARLFPRQVDTYGIFSNAEKLASRLAEVPATKYARVIRILLAQAWKKITELSPTIGLYAALGADGARADAITPAEIKTGGPSDSGISLLYKLLQEQVVSAQTPSRWYATSPTSTAPAWGGEPLQLPLWMQESTGEMSASDPFQQQQSFDQQLTPAAAPALDNAGQTSSFDNVLSDLGLREYFKATTKQHPTDPFSS